MSHHVTRSRNTLTRERETWQPCCSVYGDTIVLKQEVESFLNFLKFFRFNLKQQSNNSMGVIWTWYNIVSIAGQSFAQVSSLWSWCIIRQAVYLHYVLDWLLSTKPHFIPGHFCLPACLPPSLPPSLSLLSPCTEWSDIRCDVFDSYYFLLLTSYYHEVSFLTITRTLVAAISPF